MDYQQKKSIVSIVESVAVVAVYCIYVLGKLRQGAVSMEDTRFFAVTMLTFIGIGIAFTIAIQVVFHVLLSVSIAVREREKESKEIEHAINAAMVEDERDKIIDLKSTRIPYMAAMLGFVAGLVMLALQYPVAVMLNILFIASGLGAVGEGVAKLLYYKAGVRNG